MGIERGGGFCIYRASEYLGGCLEFCGSDMEFYICSE